MAGALPQQQAAGDLASWFGSRARGAGRLRGQCPARERGCKTNGIDNFDRVHFWRTPVSQCKSQGTCVPYYRWVSDYIAILGGR